MNRKPLVLIIGLILLTACNNQTRKEVSTEKQNQLETDKLKVSGNRLRRDQADRKAVAADMVAAEAYVQQSPPSPMVSKPYTATGKVLAYAAAAEPEQNTEKYQNFKDNPIQITSENPVSTFSIDVDTGSYSNVRRMLNNGTRPTADSIPPEGIRKYFDSG